MKNLLSRLIFLSLVIVSLGFFNFYERWKTQLVGGGDDWGYYSYLPAFFIQHDLDSLNKTIAIREQLKPNSFERENGVAKLEEAHLINNGRRVFKYTMGLAIAQFPAFAVAHVFVKNNSDFVANGYDSPYVLAVFSITLVYVFLGLLLLQKVLLKQFSANLTNVLLALLILTTNLHYFIVYNCAMAHGFLFSLYCLLIWATVHFYEQTTNPTFFKRKGILAVLIGLSIGWISLIRPTEIIAILIPLCYAVDSKMAFRLRVSLIFNNLRWLLYATLAGLLIWLPQLFYWKKQTGHWLFYSYEGEGFSFFNPHIWAGLTGYQNGWLAYTPVMSFALIGIYFLWKQNSVWRLPIAAFLPIHIWLTYSWWNWQYINGFGSRPMVEVYPLLIFSLGIFVQQLWKTQWLVKILLALILLFFTWLNLFNTYQLSKGVLWSENANTAFYWKTIGKTQLSLADQVTFDSREWQPDSNEIEFVKQIYQNDFEDSTIAHTTSEQIHSGKKAFLLTDETEFSLGFSMKAKDLPDVKPNEWIGASVWANVLNIDYNIYKMNTLVIEFSRRGKIYQSRSVRIDSKIGNPNHSIWGGVPNHWTRVFFWMRVPRRFEGDDTLKVYAWRSGRFPVFLDDLTVEIWRDRE